MLVGGRWSQRSCGLRVVLFLSEVVRQRLARCWKLGRLDGLLCDFDGVPWLMNVNRVRSRISLHGRGQLLSGPSWWLIVRADLVPHEVEVVVLVLLERVLVLSRNRGLHRLAGLALELLVRA